jgi:hypothetical protein
MQWTCALLAILTATACFGSTPQTTCSVRVRVRDVRGEPVAGLPVTLQMDSGGQTETKTTAAGTAEFCEVGWGTFSITAGFELCGQVVIRHLYIQWTQTLEVPLVWQDCHGMLLVDGCLVMLRITDAGGRPLSGASVQIGGVADRETTDAYGRIVEPLRFDTTTTVQISKSGYITASEKIACDRHTIRIERKVVLQH